MNINYRPEIDGLRAISIISVVIYHAQLKLNNNVILSGGFLGVDIFFVISGYLICSIIFKELLEKKSFSFKNFFVRRARRILPALIFLIFVSSLVSYFILQPSALNNFSKSSISSIFFSSNIFFWQINSMYMAESQLLSPLLHTWSLSVEEQFYLFFPILIFLIIKIDKKILLPIMLLLMVLSIFSIWYGSKNHIIFNFYSITSRIWEFGIGSLIAYFEYFKKKIFSFPQKINEIVCFISLIIIIYFFIFPVFPNKHPTIYTIIPILSVGLIILLSDKTSSFKSILSNNFFVFTGLLSYSLYLWHYPVFSFSRHIFINTDFENNIILKLFLIVISIILSLISYFFIEKFFRFKNRSLKTLFIFIFIFTLINIIFSIIGINSDGLKNRLKLSNFETEYVLNNSSNIYIQPIEETYKKFSSNTKKVIVVGNSTGRDFYFILKKFENENENDVEIRFLRTQIYCLIPALENNRDCLRTFDFKQKKIQKKQLKNIKDADYIILRSQWSLQDINSLKQIANYFKKDKNKKIIVVSSSPEFNFLSKSLATSEVNLSNIVYNNFFNQSSLIDKFFLKYNRYPNNIERKSFEKEYFSQLNKNRVSLEKSLKVASSQNQIDFFDFFDLICNNENKLCSVLTNDNFKIFSDNKGHFTFKGAEYIKDKIKNKGFLNLLN
jgi:peptidoglycan/LPS O-acetylase OafA/YrhL